MGRYRGAIALAIFIKLIGTLSELLLPYILEHIIDFVVPSGDLRMVLIWGAAMFAAAVFCRAFNVYANRMAVDNAHRISYEIRQALFEKTIRLSGPRFDSFTLPSLISRMTSDSYNVQSAVQQLQSLCVRAPIMLVGGVIVSLLMDVQLALILVVMLPVLILLILLISSRGIPMYNEVQRRLDAVVRIMRENITGIRVVKALSKEDFERERFSRVNSELTSSDTAAATLMAVPGPLMQLFLNIGLTAVVLVGAARVNSGETQPGVILAFLTYFNMITMGVMGLSRIFTSMSKASASADRIAQVLDAEDGFTLTGGTDAGAGSEAGSGTAGEASPDAAGGTAPEAAPGGAAPEAAPGGAAPAAAAAEAKDAPPLIVFDHVDFSYGEDSGEIAGFVGEEREKALEDISFTLGRGESLGVIGPTGCGKTTLINLLMGFYEADSGTITVDGMDVRDYDPDTLRRKFGTVFQNDILFKDTLRENIDFGRDLSESDLLSAAEASMAKEFIDRHPEGLEYEAAIKGANLSGGQKQRILVARALAAYPEILVLDDSTSALDYRTDAEMRRRIGLHYGSSALIMIAQRVSSIMNMDRILVMDNGKIIGNGTHEELMKTCAPYREICEIQIGEAVH